MTSKTVPLLKPLKPKQQEILINLIRFRYLTRPQIQRLLNHKTWKRIIIWLNELTENLYIFRFYDKAIAGKPSIYCLDKKSIPFLREQGFDEHLIKKVYEEKKRTQIFRDHNILIADIYLSLLQLTNQTHAKVTFYTKSDLYGIYYLILPHPDCYFVIKEQSGKSKYYFLDVFDDRSFLYKRMYQYLAYYENHYWQTKTKKQFPDILFVCPDERAKKSIIRFMQRNLPSDSPSFYLTTQQEIQTQGINKNVLLKVEL